jgi:hypothetical protein
MMCSVDNIPEACCSCGTKTPLADLHKASSCEYFVCSGCATYHKLPWTLGYLCEKCFSKQMSDSTKKDNNLH